jgi:GT2 family glycosyltransferase
MGARITAVVCTHNRAAYLAKALASLARQSLPRTEYDILVVDNASTDETRRVVDEHRASTPNLGYAFEPRLGLAHARNRGARVATGTLVAYLDDDAVASPQWLETLVEIFTRVRPEPGCAGGRIDPVWEAPRPDWLGDTLLPYLTILDWAPEPCTLGPTQFIAGANMAFPRRLLEAVGGFPPDLGRTGSGLLSNEELAVQRVLRTRGYSCFYHPEARVAHHVPRSRLTRAYFRRRFYWQGVSDARLTLDGERPSALTRARSVLAGSRIGVRSVLSLLPLRADARRFARHCETLRRIGYLVTMLGAHRGEISTV